MLIISVSDLLEIIVKIIENKKIILFQPKNHVRIIREVELLQRIGNTECDKYGNCKTSLSQSDCKQNCTMHTTSA